MSAEVYEVKPGSLVVVDAPEGYGEEWAWGFRRDLEERIGHNRFMVLLTGKNGRAQVFGPDELRQALVAALKETP